MTGKELIQVLRKVHDATFTPGVYEHSIYGVAADRLEALLAENEHLREVTKMMPKWVSVKERLPESEGAGAGYIYRKNPEQRIHRRLSSGRICPRRWLDFGRIPTVGEPEYYLLATLLEPPSTEGVE